jgi:hypothetical protein
LTQNILPDLIIDAQDSVTKNIIFDFKSLCSTNKLYKHVEGKFGEGVEVRQEQVNINYRVAVRNLDSSQNGNPPKTIGPGEGIFNRYGDRSSG